MIYAGKILVVDLTKSKVSHLNTLDYATQFLGGRGINAKLLYENSVAGTDPLAPENPLIFGTGALAGLPGPHGDFAPFSRVEVTSKSPETGYIGSSNFGGYFGVELKRAGYDHIVFTGRASNPVYLYIKDGVAEIHEAGSLWGQDVFDTQQTLKAEYGKKTQVACIGPAGENLVRYASVRHGAPHTAGRCGLGCVMGSKNLKAIAVYGNLDIEIEEPEKFKEAIAESFLEMKQRWWHQEITHNGHPRMIDKFRYLWDDDPDADKPPISALLEKYKPKKVGCVGCPTPCYEYYDKHKGGTSMNCAFYIWPAFTVRNEDVETLLESVNVLHRYGMDVVSCMAILRMLMQMTEAGVISAEDTDGIEMAWGDRDAILKMLDKICFRDGIGDLLANGMPAIAEKFGAKAEQYADHVKGLPIYGISSPDVIVTDKDTALNLVINTRGDTMRAHFPGEMGARLKEVHQTQGDQAYADAIHQKLEDVDMSPNAHNPHDYEGTPERSALAEDAITMNDLIGFCKLQNWHLGKDEKEHYHANFLSTAMGKKVTIDDVLEYSRRVSTLERAFNVREGMDRDTDKLPKSLREHVVSKEGRHKGNHIDPEKFEAMKSKFYRLRGWDEATGIPTRDTLEAYGLASVADDLAAQGKMRHTPNGTDGGLSSS